VVSLFSLVCCAKPTFCLSGSIRYKAYPTLPEIKNATNKADNIRKRSQERRGVPYCLVFRLVLFSCDTLKRVGEGYFLNPLI
jgi:hypothetical protein